MKDVNCKKCGEPINQGFAINPSNSDFCDLCGEECDACGQIEDKEVMENGKCFMCNETIY